MSAVNLKDTIAPKSDQLNADDLLTGPITVQVTAVTRGNSEQPISIAISGGYQPYKPCKSMRRVLIAAWGDNGAEWVGKWMTLFCDPSVRYGGVQVGGIRISHVSDIDGDLKLMLTTTRSKRAEYVVKLVQSPERDILSTLEAAAKKGSASLKAAFEKVPPSQVKLDVWKRHADALKATAAKHDDRPKSLEEQAADSAKSESGL